MIELGIVIALTAIVIISTRNEDKISNWLNKLGYTVRTILMGDHP
jgi:hypothetical protein